MKKLVCIVMALVTVNTFSFGQTKESQVEKFARLLEELESKVVKDANGEISSESLDNGLHPVTISSISEITEKNLVEAGKPYFYKIKAIYKGADREAKRIVIQDVNSDNLLNDNFLLSITNSISSVRDAGDLNEESLKRLPKESNSIATFYICAVRIDDVSREWAYWITKVRDITPCPLKNENFILSNGLSFITPDSVFAQTDQNTMAKMLLGESASNTNIFDPLSYRFVDMMDARGAMNKKKVSDDRTFPRIPVLFASDVIFQEQSGTSLTLSTDDMILTEYMNFIGRAKSITKGQKIRVYYTIAKDPLEKWEVQAIEKLK